MSTKTQTPTVAIVGHFSSSEDGQTVKTVMLHQTLENSLKAPVHKINTHGGAKALARLVWQTARGFGKFQVMLMMPATNGVQVFGPLFAVLNKLFRRKIHYIVIGGWLPELTAQKKWLAYFLKQFNGIFVETASMKTALEQQGFSNVIVLPNFKNLPILTEKELIYTTREPFAFCTFSRVMKGKGIEDAVNAVTALNTQAGRTVATLDIYGKIDPNYQTDFEKLQQTFPPFIQYKGIVPPTKSVEVLKNYFALLFPTRFATEGIPGTLIDALAAGVPVISALWNNSQDIFIENKTGYGFQLGNEQAFFTCLHRAIHAPQQFNAFKLFCLQEAQKYTPQKAIQILLTQLGVSV